MKIPQLPKKLDINFIIASLALIISLFSAILAISLKNDISILFDAFNKLYILVKFILSRIAL